MTVDIDTREERLPKWARDELATLRMRLRETRARIAELGDPASTVVADPYAEPPQPLGHDPIIEFRMPDPTNPSRPDHIHVKREGMGLRVMAGTGRIVVMPQSANVVHVRAERL